MGRYICIKRFINKILEEKKNKRFITVTTFIQRFCNSCESKKKKKIKPCIRRYLSRQGLYALRKGIKYNVFLLLPVQCDVSQDDIVRLFYSINIFCQYKYGLKNTQAATAACPTYRAGRTNLSVSNFELKYNNNNNVNENTMS